VHELSLADSVVRIAAAHAGGRRVTSVEVVVGHLRQVVPSALELAFELLARETPLEGARLEIRQVPARARCSACDAEAGLRSFPFRCSRCGSLDHEIVMGEELYVESIEVEDGDETLAHDAPAPRVPLAE